MESRRRLSANVHLKRLILRHKEVHNSLCLYNFQTLISYHQLQKFQNDFFVEDSPPDALLNSDCSTFPTVCPSGLRPISLSLSIFRNDNKLILTLTSVMKSEFHKWRTTPVIDPLGSLRFNGSFHTRRRRKPKINDHNRKDKPHTMIDLHTCSLFAY